MKFIGPFKGNETYLQRCLESGEAGVVPVTQVLLPCQLQFSWVGLVTDPTICDDDPSCLGCGAGVPLGAT